ncbi:winged helix-turn-helix transcriptional regulator [Streptomyces sp. NPDC051567]|uniref:winged helix-turn-helix transcriptional regulator n=1 Tax=Streptomyces sp. NPDC051567 TaxID=3365660 RepID=UPI0037B3EE9E
MVTRVYGQFCGLARAMEMIGERWTLLIVRNLLIGPKRYTDLRTGLPDIPTNILSTRLKQLEQCGLAVRRALPYPERAVVYELTEYGRDIEPALIELGRWGARTLTEPRSGEVVTAESLAMSLRTTFRPDGALGPDFGCEVRVAGVIVHADLADAVLTTCPGPHPGPDLIIESRTATALRDLVRDGRWPEDALADGSLHVEGERTLLERFTMMFRL